MFFESDERFSTYLIDRVSSANKHLRRVAVLSDEDLVICKLDGTVTRIIELKNITHLAHGIANGIRAGIVLMRVQGEHDLLLLHPAEAHTNVARHALQFLERLTVCRSAIVNVQPLITMERNDEAVMRAAADLERGNRPKPQAFSITSRVLLPILFEDFPVPGNCNLSMEDIDLFVDPTFVTMLTRSTELPPSTAFSHPKVIVEAPAPFRSLEVSAKFLAGFCRAYETELPLVIHVHSHMPTISSFRATKRFWAFVRRLLQVTRSVVGSVNTIAADHIEAYVVGEEKHGITATLQEWNDTMVQWELLIRQPKGKQAASMKGDTLFWQTFVSELESAALGV